MNKIKTKLVVYGSAVSALGMSLFAGIARAAADPSVASTTQAVGQSTQDNMLSALSASIPYVVVVGAAFLAFRFVWKKVKGQAH
jgi:hypothetical protein